MKCSHTFYNLFRKNVYSITVGTALLVHASLLGWIATVNAPTFDEIAHLPSGLSHWRFGDFRLYRVNPPLVRMLAALPLLATDPKTEWVRISDDPFARPEFSVGSRFLEINGYNSFWYFTICRWALIPISSFGGWVCYRWARDLFGCTSGLFALLLWCFCPNILAWGSTITPDLGAATFGVAAGYTFWRWLKDPSWGTTLLGGAAMGLAELSKSTWIVLFVIWPIIWIHWRYCGRSLPLPRPPIRQLLCILLSALYLLNLGYGFEGSFKQLGQYRFISHALGGAKAHKSADNRFRDTWLGAIPIPLPSNYVNGIDVQKYDFEVGKWSYLRGEQRFGGWYHYYLYALLIKTPLGTLFLIVFACLARFKWHEYTLAFRDELVLLFPAIAVLILVSSQTGFNRYLRYVLPAVPFLYIYASRVGKAFESKHKVTRILCGAALASSVVGSLSVFPHSMSYFNLAAGGPLGGPAHLLDANIDWGQDLLELKRFLDHHSEVGSIRLAYFGFADPKLAQFPFESISRKSSDIPGSEVDTLKPGWYAVSVNHVYGYRHYPDDKPYFSSFRKFTPKAMAGYSIYIYHITADDIVKVRHSQSSPKY